jgi:hypothetical protein
MQRIAVMFVLAFAIGAAVPVGAQTVAVSFSELEQRVDANQTIYVYPNASSESGRRIRARLEMVSGTTLHVSIDGRPRAFSEADVLMITRPHRSTTKGALIGLLAGTALDLSALHGGQLIHDCRHDPESCAWAKLGLAIVGGGGALLGTAVGHSIEHEQPLFLRPQSRTVSLASYLGAHRRGVTTTLSF